MNTLEQDHPIILETLPEIIHEPLWVSIPEFPHVCQHEQDCQPIVGQEFRRIRLISIVLEHLTTWATLQVTTVGTLLVTTVGTLSAITQETLWVTTLEQP